MKFSDIIIAETENWIAINKPAGLLSIPDREGKEQSLKILLKERYGNIYTVHRLDKETSGVIIFAKNEAAHKHLSQQFEERQTLKIYQGLVIGALSEKQGQIDAPIAEHPAKNGIMIIHRKGKPSVTEYEVLENFRNYSFLQWRLHTGRTHQIRIHMKNIGHPVVCDPLYGDGKPILVSSIKSKFKLSKNVEEERPILGRLALHSIQLGIQDMNGEQVLFEAPLSKDIKATINQLARKRL